MIIYFAAPLFTQAQRIWNREVATLLEECVEGIEILLPQDFKVNEKFNKPQHYGQIFEYCVKSIDHSQCVIAILDGSDSDSGTCFEAGYAHARGIPLIGVRTDYRENQERGVNLMLSRACEMYVFEPSFSEDPALLAENIGRRLRTLMKKIGRETPNPKKA